MSLNQLMPPVRITQDTLEPIDIVPLHNLPDGGYMFTQQAVSSLGEPTLQVIRVSEEALGSLIRTLVTFKALQNSSDR